MSHRTAASKVLPPSHPQEHYPQHRAFLIRSLGRCDTDLAALVELNRSLHKVKASIVESCGEATLLDIGEGLLKLSFDEKLVGKIPAQGEELCIDFMLRMKLRRKLLNRLARRLNRLSHAMDGEDVQPPAPPKYGDLRLHIDPKSVELHSILWKRQEEARKRIELRRQTKIPLKTSEDDAPSKVPEKAEEGDTKTEEESKVQEEESKDEERNEEGVETKVEEGETKEEGGAMEVEGDETKEVGGEMEVEEEETKKGGGEMKVGEGETKEGEEETKLEEEPKEKEGQLKEAEERELENPPEGVTSGGKPTEEAPLAADNVDDTAIDYEVLRDFNDAYQKQVMRSTGEVKKPDPELELDHSVFKYGAGIGASHRSMSSKEKEIEFKRWETAILARIPDQPSFDELGLANRVFFLEERRKRLEEQEEVMSPPKSKKKGQDDMDEKSDSEDESDDEKDDDDDMEDSNDDDMEESKDDDEDYKDGANKGDKDDMEMDDKHEEKKPKSDEAAKVEASLIKPTKPISLVAVPSFYEQDIKRLHLIHADLMASSIHEHARRRVSEATVEYNQAYRMSNEIYNLRVKTQSDLHSLMCEHRVQATKLKNDYDLEVAISRSRWQKQKEAHDPDLARRALPSALGKPTIGTPVTALAMSRQDPVTPEVGATVANIVDSVVIRSESGWKDNDKCEDFNPPPPPDVNSLVVDQNTGETLGQRQERLEGALHKELADLGTNLHASEEARKRAWKKLLKTKADFDIPHQLMSNAGGRKSRMQFDPNQFHLLPVPPLRASSVAMVPPPASYAAPPSIPSYVPQAPRAAAPPAPPAPSNVPSHVESNKYSAAKVRERIAPDGSVMPVSMPKKTKDGLYQRPAGRTRKGMDWDAVRGIWVPASNPDSWG
jgi:hypothetical protein